jgi:hypothetical protein
MARKVHWSEDLEKLPTASSRSSANTWHKITRVFSRPKDGSLKGRFPTPGTIGDEPSINDPSRLFRRSTDRSLAERNYIPPRSTVQFLPGAYDFSNNDGPLSLPTASTYIPFGTQPYDYATGSGTYSQYVSQTDNYQYPYQSPSSNQQHYQYERQELDAVAHQTYLPPSPPATRISQSSPPLSPQKVSAGQLLYESLVAQAENIEPHQARALFNFKAKDAEDLNFEEGDIITVLSGVDKSLDWW